MNDPTPELKQAAETILAAIGRRLVGRTAPLLVALDGGSGAGKSTLASMVAAELDAVLVPSDDFFAAQITAAEWEARSPESRVTDCIDWRRLRTEALEPLLAGKPAKWRAFNFESGPLPDGIYPMLADLVEREPAAVILLDGAYSARPELADLIDLSVLVDATVAGRHARLVAREGKEFLEAWHARWDAAEEYYLTQVRPQCAFDLVVSPEQGDRNALHRPGDA